jgi:hypothetical protein
MIFTHIQTQILALVNTMYYFYGLLIYADNSGHVK